MDFIKSLFKFLLLLLLTTTALSKNPKYPYIEPIDIPKEVLLSYKELVDPNLFTNITDYLLNRARYVAKFYIEGDDFPIPEYSAVINFLIIEYLNNVHPREGDDFFLERKVYSELVQDIENFRESALNNTETSISSDHYPYNLKYSKVIDFLVRTTLIGSEAMEEPNQKALFENLILNKATLNINHFYVYYYYDNYEFKKKNFKNINLGINRSDRNSPYSSNDIISLLKNIFKPTTWMLPNIQETLNNPKNNNLFNLVFYFIHTTQKGLDFSEFRRIEGAHFIDIPSFSCLSRTNLWKYILHDLEHLLDSMNHSLTSKIIRLLNAIVIT